MEHNATLWKHYVQLMTQQIYVKLQQKVSVFGILQVVLINVQKKNNHAQIIKGQQTLFVLDLEPFVKQEHHQLLLLLVLIKFVVISLMALMD